MVLVLFIETKSCTTTNTFQAGIQYSHECQTAADQNQSSHGALNNSKIREEMHRRLAIVPYRYSKKRTKIKNYNKSNSGCSRRLC